MKLNNRNYISYFLLAIIVLAVPAVSFADSKDLERLEEKEKYEKALSAINEVDVYLKNAIRENKNLCLKAFGHKLFCNCLSDNMPGPGMILLNFYQYIAATTKSKEDLKYSQRTGDEKKMIDELRRLRDKCIEATIK